MEELDYELYYRNKSYKIIAGIDEVGRGCLFGDVLACCVVMPDDKRIEGITDSKKLSKKKREAYYDQILKDAIAVGIGRADSNTIDEINIKNATHLAMMRAIINLRDKNDKQVKPDLLLIDAEHIDVQTEQVSIIKGDEKCYSISCASIVAKVYRDKLCQTWAKEYPNYQIEKNMGYGTKAHRDAIKKHGITDMHRKSFVKNRKNW